MKRINVLFTIPWVQLQLRWSNNFRTIARHTPSYKCTVSKMGDYSNYHLTSLAADDLFEVLFKESKLDVIDDKGEANIKLIRKILRYEARLCQ